MFAKQGNCVILSEQYFVNMRRILNNYEATVENRGNAKKIADRIKQFYFILSGT
jgi:hypothetical protein